eukprot:TRINITY_DN49809_c0_g1_i1.p1 TRINITY_DN49809_c0_g1~~TRINITY_DN49809_c0_g1_i1.p1  ORF type:complete len:273 (+),score=51.15 TRINITY_DN49809_c0_g1_i1:67-885(+)
MFRIVSALTVFLCIICYYGADASKVTEGSKKMNAHASVRSLMKRTKAKATGDLAQHRLRICNAYPSKWPIAVSMNKVDISGSQPLAYQQCREFAAELKAHDRLDFHLSSTYAGTFSVEEMPEVESVLVLVIYRHDVDTTAVSFQSHVFGTLQNAQLAIIDTYKGESNLMPVVTEENEQATRIEQLKYDAVVAVRPGIYEVALMDPISKEAKTSQSFTARPGQSYVAIRMGVDAEQGRKYPEELIVWPQFAGASAVRPAAMLLALVFAAVVGF